MSSDTSSEPELATDANNTKAPQPEKAEKRDAFTELLAPKSKHQREHDASKEYYKSEKRSPGSPRDALGTYIEEPTAFSSSVIVYHNDDFVVIHDRYPKSTLHLLLLPRDPSKTRLHPFDAFEDQVFLDKVRKETKYVRGLAAAELRRRYGGYSAQEQARREAMGQEPPPEPDEIPAGRDWEREVMCGIHAHPSMNHLHVHVMSVDRYSERLRHKKHYNSFSTPFFVDVEDFPLAGDDARRFPAREGYLKRDFICWRCGRDFGSGLAKLKAHLEEEFNEWKRL